MPSCGCWACYKASRLFPNNEELQERFRHAFCVTRIIDEKKEDEAQSFKGDLSSAEKDFKKIQQTQRENEKKKAKNFKELFGTKLTPDQEYREAQRIAALERTRQRLTARDKVVDIVWGKPPKDEASFDNFYVFDMDDPRVTVKRNTDNNKKSKQKPKQIAKSDPGIDLDLTQESKRKIKFEDE